MAPKQSEGATKDLRVINSVDPWVLKSNFFSVADKPKIVHFVIKAPNLVHRLFKSYLLISEWVPPNLLRVWCNKH